MNQHTFRDRLFLIAAFCISIESQAATYVGSLLHPATGYLSSFATGASDANQVGDGFDAASNRDHALLWTGSAASAVNLNPPSWAASIGTATSGANQVGRGYITFGGNPHAVLWSGTAASYVDLH